MREDTERIFERGIEYHQQGQLALAKAAYAEVLRAQPAHSNALHLLGVIAAQSNEPALAVQLIGQAIAANPDFAEAYSSLATALMELNQVEQGLSAFERAIALKPGYAEAHYNRGLALQKLGSMPFRMELDITGIYGLGDPEVAGRVAMGWVASS